MSIEAWASAPAMTRIGGAPVKPCSSTSQSTRASTACRAAASALKLAIVAPVTKAPALPAGKRRTSSNQSSAISSSAAATGDAATRPPFWSHANGASGIRTSFGPNSGIQVML